MHITKICKQCKTEKELSEFHKQKSGKYGRRNICKLCRQQIYYENSEEILKKNRIFQKNNSKLINKRNKDYNEKYPWKKAFNMIIQRCNNLKNPSYKHYGGRGIECRITKDEIEFLWFRDDAYLMKKPSIDRKDNDGNYELSNCRFIEFYLNAGKDKHIPILQYSKKGEFIKEWQSAMIASKYFKGSESNIRANLYNRSKSAFGFIWKYKNI